MMADTEPTQQNKQSQVEPQQVKKPEPAAASPPLVPERPTLASGEDSIERHVQLLGDSRIHAGKRQKLASWINRTRGNQYLQRVIDASAPERGSIQRDGDEEGGEEQSIEDRLNAAMEGWGTDEDAIMDAIRDASDPEKQAILNNPTLMSRLADELSRSDMLQVLEGLNAPIADRLYAAMEGWGTDEDTIMRLTANATDGEKRALLADSTMMARLKDDLTEAELLNVAKNLVNVSGLPAGKIQDAAALLAVSPLEVDRNTALRLVNGDVVARYIDDLSQPPNVDTLVTSYGRDPADWTLYYKYGSTTDLLWVQKNAQGFRVVGEPNIYGFRRLTLDRWQTLLVHETNHARNVDPSTPLENYKSEFRAYWVAEFRGVEDLDERARQIKAHVLNGYPLIKAAYDADETVRNAIDAHTRPDDNITNI
ncbi:MAG: hypothetical protein JXA42_13925 [Anaerolineales bacterium]|nr:hypothetical protein [Anaerolineales bacterium]